MNEDGRVEDVLFEDLSYDDPKTGMKVNTRMVTVWADKGMLDVIKNVAGVASAYNNFGDYEYTVFFDPRYDKEFVKNEIKKAILNT